MRAARSSARSTWRRADSADRRPLLVGHRGADHLADAFLRQPRPRARAARHRRRSATRDIPVSLSSDILPEFREYDRAITTVMNDYVRPIMRRYLSRIEDRLQRRGRQRAAAHRPLRRRPDERVGGLRAARCTPCSPVPPAASPAPSMLSRRSGFPKLLAFDMGGTSTDVSVIIDGEATHLALDRGRHVSRQGADARRPQRRRRRRFDRRRFRADRSLRVGPRSAGARPGPVCLWPRRHGADGERRQCRARLPAAAAARRRHGARRRGGARRPSPASASSISLRPKTPPRASSTSPTK